MSAANRFLSGGKGAVVFSNIKTGRGKYCYQYEDLKVTSALGNFYSSNFNLFANVEKQKSEKLRVDMSLLTKTALKAASYPKFRPAPPPELIKKIVGYLNERVSENFSQFIIFSLFSRVIFG